MTDQGPLGRPPRGASVPGGAPCGAGPQLIPPFGLRIVTARGLIFTDFEHSSSRSQNLATFI